MVSERSSDVRCGTFSLGELMARVYVLVVVQHPQRARACGFGDKVRPSYRSSTCKYVELTIYRTDALYRRHRSYDSISRLCQDGE